MWYAVGNYEYQSIDTTWIVNYPRIFTAMTHLTLFWEVFYCALVWPRLTRPIAVGLAVVVHAGIAMFLGMITFGTMMIAANMVFVEPGFLVRLLGRAPEERKESEVAGHGLDADARRLQEREAALIEREESLRLANERLLEKKGRMRNREVTYRNRVRRLKEREGKIKRLVERRRRSTDDTE